MGTLLLSYRSAPTLYTTDDHRLARDRRVAIQVVVNFLPTGGVKELRVNVPFSRELIAF